MNARKLVIVLAVAALAVAALVALLTPRGGALPASGQVTSAQLRDVVARGVRLVDVRTAAEYSGGHIQGAENVPMDALPTSAKSWSKTAPVALYCQTGARSRIAYDYLVAQGFTNVYDLTGGVTAWDGDIVRGATGTGTAKMPATTLPTMYDFSSNT
ncbi:MAG TPA: rhodanese-like domain-containing protein [Coriobacteriia bacterium]